MKKNYNTFCLLTNFVDQTRIIQTYLFIETAMSFKGHYKAKPQRPRPLIIMIRYNFTRLLLVTTIGRLSIGYLLFSRVS
jgi:hypothetical protein